MFGGFIITGFFEDPATLLVLLCSVLAMGVLLGDGDLDFGGLVVFVVLLLRGVRVTTGDLIGVYFFLLLLRLTGVFVRSPSRAHGFRPGSGLLTLTSDGFP